MTEIGQRLAFAGESPDQTRAAAAPPQAVSASAAATGFAMTRAPPVGSGRPPVAREGESGALILMRDDESQADAEARHYAEHGFEKRRDRPFKSDRPRM
jgi:hypothetical protein